MPHGSNNKEKYFNTKDTYVTIDFSHICSIDNEVKAVYGPYSTAALRHIVLLPEWVPSFIFRGAVHTKRRERPLLAKEGTIPGI